MVARAVVVAVRVAFVRGRGVGRLRIEFFLEFGVARGSFYILGVAGKKSRLDRCEFLLVFPDTFPQLADLLERALVPRPPARDA